VSRSVTATGFAHWAIAGSLLAAPAVWGSAERDQFIGPPAPPIVDYDEGRVSIVASGQPLSTLLGRLADAAGMQLRGTPCADPPVHIRFDELPLRKAVERLLGDCNFTMRFGADRAPRRLTLRGPPVPSEQPRRTPTTNAHYSFFRRLADHPPLSVSGALAAALGTTRVQLLQLARAMGTQPNASVRAQAMQRLLAAIEGDPILRAGFRDMTPDQLTRFARANAKTHASELTFFLSRRARDATVRTKARAALSGLR